MAADVPNAAAGAPGVLAAILRSKEAEVAALTGSPVVARHLGGARASLVTRALARDTADPLRLVTEIKRRSPSAGPLSTALSVADRALAYARGGVSMISVLCDGPFFDGSWDHVAEARRALDEAQLTVPILAKEFVISDRQLDEAAASGADAVLLIARLVTTSRLADLVDQAVRRGLEPLVEVVTEDELSAALTADARVIGVNARDLDTLAMDSARPARVLAAIPKGRIAVHLSGIKTADDVAAIAQSPVSAALIGEALMRADDPTPLLGEFVRAAKP